MTGFVSRRSTYADPVPYVPREALAPVPWQAEPAHRIATQSPPTATPPPEKRPGQSLAVLFLIVSSCLALFSLWTGLPALETGLLCALTAAAAGWFLGRLRNDAGWPREAAAALLGTFAFLTGLVLLPWLGLWPTGGGPLLFAFVFALVGTAARSRAALLLSVTAILAMVIGSDGPTGLRLDVQVATVALLAVGLTGAISTRSPVMAALSTVVLAAGLFFLLLSFGVPEGHAFAILSVFAIAGWIALSACGRRGHEAAKPSARIALVIALLAATGYQFALLGLLVSPDQTLGTMPAFGVVALLMVQLLVLGTMTLQWTAGRCTITDLVFTQAGMTLLCTILADPMRLSRLGAWAPLSLIAGLIAIGMALASLSLFRTAWTDRKPLLAPAAGFMLLIQIALLGASLGLGIDILLVGWLGVSAAIGLAVAMATLEEKKERMT